MTLIDEMQKEPWRFDFFSVMRRLERSHYQRPRIGDSSALREEYVQLGQDPYLEFPASNLSRVLTKGDRIRVFVRFLGLLGPQGALPLTTTEEAFGWFWARDEAFPRFLDVFNNRFLQLFFRAWADSRPIAQHDRPEQDRFVAYIGSTIGVGSAPYRDLDSIPDAAKLAFAGLIAAQAKSASRLKGFISGLFGAAAEIDEFVETWLSLEPPDRSRLGQSNSGLGTTLALGARILSVQDKFRIRLFTKDLARYTRFLPTGDLCEPLADAVFFYIGDQLEWEVELAMPSGAVEPMRLGSSGQLGWTSWMAPNWTSSDAYRRDARFQPAERMRQKRRGNAKGSRREGGSDGGHHH
jgi:type VI secretion system protein ImpH